MNDMNWPAKVVLTGTHVRLEPLTPEHRGGLAEAVADGELWKLWYTFVPPPERMADEIAKRCENEARGTMRPFAVTVDGRPAGMTTYMNIDAAAKRLEIGGTWYRRSLQRGPVNTECKFLLLRHAFEQLDCIAVEFRTHFLNRQSRQAIERLGAKLDGVLRNHMRMPDGSLRDTCVYSILPHEWPAARANLVWQMERPRPG